MDIDHNAFCEKIISAIDQVFKSDKDLVGFEIIPVPFNQNKSPVIHLNHNLGLESWCIKFVYEFAHKTVLNNRKDLLKSYNLSIIKYLNCATLINPDVSTFWNIRRQLVEKLHLDLTQEFLFSAIVLSKKPKSSEAFFYRRWLYGFQSIEAIDWNFEISLCERCAEKKAGNYHAWNHRQWVLQKGSPSLLKFELARTEKFIRKNISDYSCYHHRHFVLVKMWETRYYDHEDLNNGELFKFTKKLFQKELSTDELMSHLIISKEALDNEKLISFLYCLNRAVYDLELCEDLVNSFGYYEAFECYRKITVQYIFDIIQDANSNYLNSNDRMEVDSKDFEILELMKKVESSKKFEGTVQEKHKKWCKIFLKFDY